MNCYIFREKLIDQDTPSAVNINNKCPCELTDEIPLQLLACYLAIRKNIDPDYPRNLAKSVTVK